MQTLREVRMSKSWTQTMLAGSARMNAATISLIETGRLTPSKKQAQKIAAALGVKTDDVAELREAHVA